MGKKKKANYRPLTWYQKRKKKAAEDARKSDGKDMKPSSNMEAPESMVYGIPLDHSYCKVANEAMNSKTIQDNEIDPVEPVVCDERPSEPVTAVKANVDSLPHLLNQKLPRLWGAQSSDAGLHILKFSSHISRVVQRSIFVNMEGVIKVFIHGVCLDASHDFMKACKSLDFEQMDSSECVNVLLNLVSTLRVYDVCCGVTKVKYEKFWTKINNCVIDTNLFHEERFQRSCRSQSCDRIVQQTRRVCDSCLKLSKALQKKLAAAPADVPDGEKQATPHKNKPLIHLSTPERKARFQRLTKTIKNLKRINERLRKKVEEMVHHEGVDLDEDTDECLQDIITDPGNQEKITDFHKLFLQQQLQARNVGGKSGMRWHPLMIRFALYLKLKAGQSAYKELRNFIHLPNERTLYDYSHTVKVKEGAHDELINNVADKVDNMKHDYQRYHVLLFDEVYIQQNLATRKTDGTLVGYCHLDSVQEEMIQLERTLDAAAQEAPVTPLKSPPMAKTVLAYMVKGVASNIHLPVGSYSSSCLNKEDLYMHTWEVIEKCELNDIYICSVVCDGSGVNRAFFDMHPPKTPTESGVVFDTVNPYAPERDIYFLSDPPHLLKTIRNCFANSGMQKKGKRKLHKNGQDILWSTIISLYNLKANQTIKKLHKLDAACVFLNKFSVMKVRYAARVLSDSVAGALEERNWPDTSETCIFKAY